MIAEERDRIVANMIRRGECPFGQLHEDQSIARCPSGFPGCGCADELQFNPFLDAFEAPDIPEINRRNPNGNS